MLLAKKGILSVAQACTDGAVDSTNVIDMGDVANAGVTDAWLAVQTNVLAGGGSTSTYKVALVVATEATLDTVKEIVSVTITGLTDARIATAGKPILAINVGKMLNQLCSATYRYVGLIVTLANGNGTATLAIDAALSNSEPRTEDKAQVVDSNVGVPVTL